MAISVALNSWSPPVWSPASMSSITPNEETQVRFSTTILLVFLTLPGTAFAQDNLQLVSGRLPDGPAAYGIDRLAEALSARDVAVARNETIRRAAGSHAIVAGLASDRAVAELVTASGLKLPQHPEGLSVCRVQESDHDTVVLCGGGPVGLMYAALDTAERIGWALKEEDLFAHVANTSESPHLTDRSISTYTMQRKLFEQRLYDKRYWQRYFDMLAKSRINSYVIIFGYENGGFMAPIYPYFFDVEGFPDVQLYEMTPQQQARNTKAFQRVIDLAHERGIRVTAGIWDHIYRGGVQGGGIAGASELVGKRAPHLVYGVTTENLAPYTKAALRKFLTVFPDIDGIQFRMHWESGLTRKETPAFWRDVFSMLKGMQPDIQVDLRAKGLPDEVIEEAVAQELPFRITTKFWMEQLGLPFHPTHVNPQNQRDRRHGYADLLRYPKRYDMHWRIWSGGTARFLLWGDPQYVRRFVDSVRLYGGTSFEVNEMLATKMLGEPHDEEPYELLMPPYQHYDYEFERYWHYYQIWGRVSYNPDVSPELWERKFVQRFGPKSGPLIMKSLHAASNILPRIVAASYNYRYFPTTRGWAEMMRLGDLPEYAKGTGTDVEQFQSYEEAATKLLADEFTAKRTPFQTSRWFTTVADQILADVKAAEATAQSLQGSAAREYIATATDLKILACLAKYHASRMRAAVWYNVYLQSEDKFALEHCIANESEGVENWQRIIESAGDVYPKTLKFGVHRVGFSWHWTEELEKLEAGLAELRLLTSRSSLADHVRTRILQRVAASTEKLLRVDVSRPSTAEPGGDLTVTATVMSEDELESIRLRYRHLTQFEDYESTDMIFDSDKGRYVATIPGASIVPEWDLMYFVEAVTKAGDGRMAPDMEEEMPYVIVPVKR